MKIIISAILGIILIALVPSVSQAYCSNPDYREYDAIIQYLQELAGTNRSEGFAKVITIGSTVEKRDIKGLVITKDANEADNKDKPDVVIFGGIHADE